MDWVIIDEHGKEVTKTSDFALAYKYVYDNERWRAYYGDGAYELIYNGDIGYVLVMGQ